MILFYCLVLYFSVTLFFSVFLWAALVLAKRDDINSGTDIIEGNRFNRIEKISLDYMREQG
jgi:hypothetical protein